MGTDKGLLMLASGTWAQSAAAKIGALSLPVVIAINASQYIDYSAAFPSTQLIIDNKKLAIKGPLCGVLSVHLEHSSEDLLVLACDMLLMEPALLSMLFNHYQTNPGFDAYIFLNAGEWEPLCGIYTAKALAAVLQWYNAGQLEKHSMKYILERINTFKIPVANDQQHHFRNFNSQAELHDL